MRIALRYLPLLFIFLLSPFIHSEEVKENPESGSISAERIQGAFRMYSDFLNANAETVSGLVGLRLFLNENHVALNKDGTPLTLAQVKAKDAAAFLQEVGVEIQKSSPEIQSDFKKGLDAYKEVEQAKKDTEAKIVLGTKNDPKIATLLTNLSASLRSATFYRYETLDVIEKTDKPTYDKLIEEMNQSPTEEWETFFKRVDALLKADFFKNEKTDYKTENDKHRTNLTMIAGFRGIVVGALIFNDR